MSKLRKEDCRSFSIFDLKKWNYLNGDNWRSGNIIWTNSSGDKNTIGIVANLINKEDRHIELNYKTKGYWEEEWEQIKSKIPLITTRCNYGGDRYWFRCMASRNGVFCGRRVATLYKGGNCNYFACRHCYNLTYQSRIDGWAYSDDDLDKLGMSIKRWHYRDRLTRKHKRYIKINKVVAGQWANFLTKINKRLDRGRK